MVEWLASVLLVNTSLESLRSVWVRLRDASASVPGGFWTAVGAESLVVALGAAVTCWVMPRTRLSDDLVRRMNMALLALLDDEAQWRLRPFIGLCVVRCSERLGAIDDDDVEEEDEDANEVDGVAAWSHGVIAFRRLQMHDVNLAASVMVLLV